jgi:hypothetical protein
MVHLKKRFSKVTLGPTNQTVSSFFFKELQPKGTIIKQGAFEKLNYLYRNFPPNINSEIILKQQRRANHGQPSKS